MTTGNKRKLAALNEENCEEHPRSNLAQNSSALRSQEDYITQVSEEIEGRVTKRLSKEISRTEDRILGALARLDDFLMNPLLPGHSGTTPEPSRNVLNTSQGTNEDDSQNDPLPQPEDTKLWPRRRPRQLPNCTKLILFTGKGQHNWSHSKLLASRKSLSPTIINLQIKKSSSNDIRLAPETLHLSVVVKSHVEKATFFAS